MKVKIKNAVAETAYQSVTFIAGSGGIWSGQATFTVPVGTYSVLIKGPKHNQRKICHSRPSESDLGLYRCNSFGIPLNVGSNDLDFTAVTMLAGDLPVGSGQNGVVNSEDITTIRDYLGKSDDSALRLADVNLDGVVNTQDYSLVIEALSIKTDEE